MWERVANLFKTVVTLSEELKQNREDIKEIRQDLRDLTLIVHRLASDIEHTKELQARERENVMLQLENTFLRFERQVEHRLPPPRDD